MKRNFIRIAAAVLIVLMLLTTLAACTGPIGEQGPRGIQGAQGIQGEKGDKGDAGAKGEKGDKGDKGDAGAAGVAGTNGQTPYIKDGNWWIGDTDTGVKASGLKGDTGATGATGPAGAAGYRGETGPAGPEGPAGAAGIGVSDAYVDDAGHLWIVLSDGSTKIDAGRVAVKHTVTFLDWDGTPLKVQAGVIHGGAAEAPAKPSRNGHFFDGWSEDFDCVTEDMVITAKYTRISDPIPEELSSVVPSKLPDGGSYTIYQRYGLEKDTDYLGFGSSEGKIANITWGAADGAVSGNGLSFNCNMSLNGGSGNRAEGNLMFLHPFTIEDVKGIMFHVDFSKINTAPGKALSASVTINGNTYRSAVNGRDNGLSPGYYYENGQWILTGNISACRMQVPDSFKGWIYVPLTSYTGAGTLYDAYTGLGLSNVMVMDMNLYSDGYEFTGDSDKLITFDEILFVK